MSHEAIAAALDIDRKTLEKHYQVELTVAASTRRQEIIAAMYKAAIEGNVAAQKAYLALRPAATIPDTEKPGGKKEQAQADAKTAHEGTDWGDDLAPAKTAH